jgi:hypothetical protein
LLFSWRYYEVFRRARLNASKQEAAANGYNGEPEKKKARGGRPKIIKGVDTQKLIPNLTNLEKEELAKILNGAESLSEKELALVMKYDQGGALIQDEIYHHSFSAAKALCPAFFTSPIYLRALFSSICVGKDIFHETDTSLASEMKILDEYLFESVDQGCNSP